MADQAAAAALLVKNSDTLPLPSSPWVSFDAGGAAGEAPTPTLLKPTSSFRNGSSSDDIAAFPARPIPAAADLGLTKQSSGNTQAVAAARSAGGQPRPPPMRSSSSGGGVAAAPASLSSYPLQLTPGTSPLGISISAPASAKPSPVRTASMQRLAGLGGNPVAPAQPGSPMTVGPVASGSSGGSLLLSGSSGRLGSSAGSRHRRNVTAPDGGFFDELNPLCPPSTVGT